MALPAVSHRAASPADETDRFLEAIEPLLERFRADRRRRESDEYRASLVILMALRLSGGDLAIGEALLRGERVPRSRLAPEWLKAYGL